MWVVGRTEVTAAAVVLVGASEVEDSTTAAEEVEDWTTAAEEVEDSTTAAEEEEEEEETGVESLSAAQMPLDTASVVLMSVPSHALRMHGVAAAVISLLFADRQEQAMSLSAQSVSEAMAEARQGSCGGVSWGAGLEGGREGGMSDGVLGNGGRDGMGKGEGHERHRLGNRRA